MNFGRVGFVMEGDWSAAVTYDTLSIVLYEGAVYAAKRMSAGSEPSTHPADWLRWVESPIVSAEQTENGYDLTITNGDGTTSVVHLLNGQITEAELTIALSGLREAFNANIAEGYSSSSVYSEGDYCLYNNVLYRCKTDILSPEAWDSTHWEAASLADDVQDLSENLYNNKVDAITSTASGEIVTIDDGADGLPIKDMTVSLFPIQDLHGQSAPYPPGGGKNLYNKDADYKSAGKMWNSGTGGLFDSVEYYGSPKIPVSPSTQYVRNTGATANIFFGSDGNYLSYAFTGTAITTPDNAYYVAFNTAVSVDNGTIQLEKGTVSTAWSPYSNVCPISGRTGVEVYRCGTDYDTYSNQDTVINGVNVKISDHRVKLKGTTIAQIDKYLSQPIDGTGETLTLNVSHPMPDSSSFWYVYDTTASSVKLRLYGTTATSGTFETVVGHQYRVGCLIVNGTSIDIDAWVFVTKGNIETIPITWQSSAGTVYGCNIDPVSGVLTVDMISFDLGDASWELNSARFLSRNGLSSNPAKNVGTTTKPNAICDTYKTLAWNSVTTLNDGSFSAVGNQIIVSDSRYSTSAEFKTAVAGTKIVYELATPLTFQLTPIQIATLLGTNNFWSNSNGQIDLEYRADTKLYIQQLTKPSEDDMIANQNIQSGKFFMVGNRLMLSTTAIAQGETIVVGTNCSEVSLADALNQINA